ncbi:MAG TPA: hypothetical protein VMG34_10525 [Bacteroidota bacterium]|nr:hypothetical protein [Bacteroidota bacterium]
MRLRPILFFCFLAVQHLFAQVSTETELANTKQPAQARPGYFFYAKPYEVTMTVNLWGEVPQQGVYVIPTTTDIIQLISFAGGPRETSNLDEVLLFRSPVKKGTTAKTLMNVDVRAIMEGKSPTVMLAPGDMIVVKRLSEKLTFMEVLNIINTVATLTVLGIEIHTLTK